MRHALHLLLLLSGFGSLMACQTQPLRAPAPAAALPEPGEVSPRRTH